VLPRGATAPKLKKLKVIIAKTMILENDKVNDG